MSAAPNDRRDNGSSVRQNGQRHGTGTGEGANKIDPFANARDKTLCAEGSVTISGLFTEYQ